MAVQPTAEDIDRTVAGLTVPTLLARQVGARAGAVAIKWREGDDWAEWTWGDYADRVARAAGGLGRLGVGRGDRAVMMLRNVPEFHVADTALCHLGVTPVSIYNSSAPEQVEYLVNHCEARVAIVEDIGFLERFLKVRDQLPNLEHVVVVRDPDGAAPPEVLRWDDLLAGEDADLGALAGVAQPDDLATLIYTSGTTGPPKAVAITHYNVAFTVESLRLCIDQDMTGWRQISYLPMAHIAERITGHYGHLFNGAVVHCCPDTTQVAAYLGQVKPELFFGVPRVFEKIHAGVMAFVSNEADPDRKAGMERALEVGRQVAELQVDGAEVPADLAAEHEQVDAAVLGLARALVGLDEARVVITGAAPISIETLWFFRAIGVPMSEIYGMSESTGPMTWDPYEVRMGTVGRAIPGCTVRLEDDGEVVFRGGNAFQGYLKDPEKTAEAIDAEGWVHSGDIGRFDDDGYLTIYDRKKELIITAGGKNISPANLESSLKSHPLVGQVCVVGDRRKYLAALVVLDPDVAPAWARSHGIEADLASLATHPEVVAEVQRAFDEVNRGVSQTEAIKRFTILPDEWLPDSEELTPTMKLKRRGIHTKYAAEIEALYA